MKPWYHSKTIYVSLAGIVTAVGTYLSGEIALSKLLEIVFEAGIAICIRSGIGLGKKA